MIEKHKIEKADVVVSLNGRDEGKRFLVIRTEDEYALLVDGRLRKVEKPKRKKQKHVKLESRAEHILSEKIISGEKVTNKEIRRMLSEYSEARGEEGGM